MFSIKSIQKRKVKKIYGGISLSIGIFCLVLGLCVGEFFLLNPQKGITSPLPSWKKAFFAKLSPKDGVVNQISDLCKKDGLQCQNIVVNSSQNVTLSTNGISVILSMSKNIEQEIASLQLTIKQLTMEGKEVHRLDFRYDRPVISY